MTIKIITYSLVTFVAVFFYFERFYEYGKPKRYFFGLIILAVFGFGIWDICETIQGSNQDKKDLIDTTKKTGKELGVK